MTGEQEALVSRLRELQQYRRGVYKVEGDDVDCRLAEAADRIVALEAALLTARDYVEDTSKGIPLRGTGFEETARQDLAIIDAALSQAQGGK